MVSFRDVAATDIESSWDQVVDNFEDMNLKPDLLRGIRAYGLDIPSAIQQRAIVPAIEGRDIVVQSHPGTGKTVASAISILQKIDTSTTDTQALILAPSRELAEYIQDVLAAIGSQMGIKCHACVGGTSVHEDKAKLQDAHVVVGTSGRVKDMINRHALRSDKIKLFYLVEADEMLAGKHKSQVQEILKLLPQNKQVIISSYTLPEDVREAIKELAPDPVRILVKVGASVLEGIQQFRINGQGKKWKLQKLYEIYGDIARKQAAILCNRSQDVQTLAQAFHARNLTVSAILGQMEQKERKDLIESFQSGSSRVLVTIDLHSRGFDAQQVPLIINYNLPTDPKDYIYRVSRKGASIALVSKDDAESLRDIEKFYGVKINETPLSLAELI